MAFVSTYVQNIIVNGEQIGVLASSYSTDGLDSRDLVIPDSTTDQLVDLAFTRADCSLILFFSDQDVTLEFNDDAGGGGSISLGADFPWIWHTDKEDLTLSDVITADVTALYVTNASGSEANVQVRVAHNSTP